MVESNHENGESIWMTIGIVIFVIFMFAVLFGLRMF